MALVSDVLKTITQRTGTMFDITKGEGRDRFLFALTTDVAAIIQQINNVYNPLVSGLAEIDGVTTLDAGIVGNVIYTDFNSTAGVSSVFWDSGLSRAKTIKESFDTIIASIAALNIALTTISSSTTDETVSLLISDIASSALNEEQLALDTFGPGYQLDNDGNANTAYPLAQHIAALGSFFNGFPGVGTSVFSNTYPSLQFPVNLSDVTLDTTVPIATVTGLTAGLSAIKAFVGMDSPTDSSPNYSDHGSIAYVADGQSLESSIQTLDDAINTLAGVSDFTTVATLSGTGLSTDDHVNLTTDGLAVSASNMIELPANKAATLYIQYVFAGKVSGNPIIISGLAVGCAYRLSGNTLISQTMDIEGSIGSDVGEQDYVVVGTSGGGPLTTPATVDFTFVANAPGIYFKINTGISMWDGPIRANALVRIVRVDL